MRGNCEHCTIFSSNLKSCTECGDRVCPGCRTKSATFTGDILCNDCREEEKDFLGI